MFSRKSMFVALTVLMMLAMLVPAAMAAPEWVHGIALTSPTTAKPAYVDPYDSNGLGNDNFKIKYDLTIVGTQVDDIWVRYRAVDMNNSVVVWEWHQIWPGTTIKTGVNSLTSGKLYPTADPGWYRVEVCAMDGDWNRVLFCDSDDNALLVDIDDPGARLIKPDWNSYITGQNYLLVGKAWDPYWAENDPLMRYGGIKATWFEYCVYSNWQGAWCGPADKSWVWIADGVPTPGVADQYQANWDSSQVPDDWGRFRFCAEDFVGRTVCDYHDAEVNNRFTMDLFPGWNLISLPIRPYVSDITNAAGTGVMDHLLHANAVASVATYDAATGTWMKWNADKTVPSNLTEMVDGPGYWVWVTTPTQLTVVGTWLATGTEVPPEYPVYESWNLVGYTHWGQPTWWGNKSVYDYLSTNSPAFKAMWAFDPWVGAYYQVTLNDWMSQGAGYWLALAQAGSINP